MKGKLVEARGPVEPGWRLQTAFAAQPWAGRIGKTAASWGEKAMQDVLDIQVTPLSPACGAEISGVDLTRPLPPETVKAIRDAWNKYIVLVFRGQQVSQDDQLRFASYFGELGERKRAKTQLAKKIEGTQQTNPNVLLVTNIKENGVPIGAFGEGEFWFHIDGGYTERPYRYTF